MADERTDGPAVRVAVLNGRVPAVASRSLARRSLLRVTGSAAGLGVQTPGLDLLVLPEYAVHGTGCQPSGRPFTDPDDDLGELARVCRRSGTWLAAPLGGGAVHRSGAHRMVLLDPSGRVVARYHRDATGDPRYGRADDRWAVGPGGLRTVLTFADVVRDATHDPGLHGAELVVALRTGPSRDPRAVLGTARALAWTHGCYVAAANTCGTDGVDRWVGWSSIVGHRGEVLARCEDEECEVAVADLDPARLRRDRRARSEAATAVRTVLHRTRARLPRARRTSSTR